MTARDLLDLPQVSPAGWGARLDYDARTPLRKDGTTIHYAGMDGFQKALLIRGHDRCPVVLRAIERDHIDKRGWSGIGYNWAACPHGTLFRLRGLAYGAHNPGDTDRDRIPDNIESVGLLFMTGPGEIPTLVSQVTAGQVVRTVGGYVAPHSQSRSTECPGDEVRAIIPTLGDTQERHTMVPYIQYVKEGDGGEASEKKAAVLYAQHLLIAAGADIEPDGLYGPNTAAAVDKVIGYGGADLSVQDWVRLQSAAYGKA